LIRLAALKPHGQLQLLGFGSFCPQLLCHEFLHEAQLMADPLSIAASAAGLITLGVSACSSLVQFYSSWKDSNDDIKATYDSLSALAKTFRLIDEKIKKASFSRDVVEHVTESIISCAAGIQSLRSKLDKISVTKPGVSAYLRRAQYPFREKTLVKLQGTIADLRSNLTLAVDALQIDASSTTLQRLRLLGEKVDDLAELSKAASADVLQAISDIRLVQNQQTARSLSTDELNAVSWLSPLDCRAKQSDVLGRHQQGTGRWLLESDEFCSWLRDAGSVLWCHGIRKSHKCAFLSIPFQHVRVGDFMRLTRKAPWSSSGLEHSKSWQ
jgi:hypothetical protein